MEIQKVAKTVNLAIDEALKELDTTIDNIEYEVLQQPSKGFLGIGSKPAKVLIRLKQQTTNETINTTTNTEKTQNRENVITFTEKCVPKMVTDDQLKNKKQEKQINENASQIATKFLTEVFEKMKINVFIDAKIDTKNNLSINLKGDDIGVLIGKRGQTLDSLQYLTNLVINKGEFSYMAVNLDVEDYRQRRKQTLEQLALNLAKKAKKTKHSIKLEPMNPYERRIIHGTLHSDPNIKTYSEGKEPFRYVVISPR